jgi:nucleoside phosphorylase
MELKNMTVDFLIITALPEELEALRSYLPHGTRVDSGHCELTYYVGSLDTEQSASYSYGLTCLYQMGNTESGVCTSYAIRDLDPSYVIMFGIAAGIKERANLCDVVVATRVFYYAQAKLHPAVVEVRPQSYQADTLLCNKLKDFASSYDAGFKVMFGPFAVGEKVVADSRTIEDLQKYEPKLLGVEMESYGVARAASGSFHRPRFIAIRGVSDFADEHKGDEFRSQALRHAAAFFVAFLKATVLPREKACLTQLDVSQTLIAIHHLSLNQRTSIVSCMRSTPMQGQNLDVQELLIDQTDLYENGRLVDPVDALQRQRDLIHRVNHFIDRYPNAQIAYLGLAHIPLVFHAGYEINRCAIRLLTTNRQTGEWIPLLPDAEHESELCIQEAPSNISDEVGDVVVRMSISYRISRQQINGIVKEPLASFHLSLSKPRPDAIISEKQVNDCARAFHQLLVDINAHFPKTRRIHLFIAAPPTVVFRCGQQVSKTVDPDILVYNFSNKDQPNYGWAVNVATGEVIELRSNSQEITHV